MKLNAKKVYNKVYNKSISIIIEVDMLEKGGSIMSKVSEQIKKKGYIKYQGQEIPVGEDESLDDLINELKKADKNYQNISEEDFTISKNGEVVVNPKRTVSVNGVK